MRKSKDLPPKLVENTYNYKAIIEFLLIKEKAFKHVKIMKHRGVLYRYGTLSTRTLVTLPKGIPRWMISASDTSLGMFRMWITCNNH